MLWIIKRLLRRVRGSSLGEGGYIMTLVLVTLTFLSVLGALLLLLLGVVLSYNKGVRPSFRAFCIADSALALAHKKIVDGGVPQDGTPLVLEGDLLEGRYLVEVRKKGFPPNTYEVFSQGEYGNGRYKRAIKEEVEYEGEQAYDVMRNYIVYAGGELRVRCRAEGEVLSPVFINGNLGARNKITILLDPMVASLADALTVNGDLDCYREVNVTNKTGLLTVHQHLLINGNINTGNESEGVDGVVNLRTVLEGFPLSFGIRASSGMGQNIKCRYFNKSIAPRSYIDHGPVLNQRGARSVYIPKPNFNYYRALAESQNNILTSGTLSGSLGSRARSTLTVLYYPGGGTLTIRGFLWNQTRGNGVIISEGDIVVKENLALFEGVNLKLIAKGNVYFDDNLEFGWGVTNRVVIWSGRDVSFDLGFLKKEYCQITAMGNVIIRDGGLLGDVCEINYQPPDIDVFGFPIEMKVKSWMEVTPR